ncbi:unnamed protein product [Colletotrichum noveboracense]|uniref:Uncharacterized protein n=1 Tax=Colletotrichum noveboracense TaxID=2664923 RepID=A0A9W4WG62_9PEZI|nr:unnamed protein product [Colletotrichum noveboracense]
MCGSRGGLHTFLPAGTNPKPDPGTWVRGGGSRCVQSFAYTGGVGWPPHRFR